jgi:16S rRNA (cytidine1402-2'-O)-methyltransferase
VAVGVLVGIPKTSLAATVARRPLTIRLDLMIDDIAGKDGVMPLPGGLYLVATPIGNASDITLRALDVLRRADAIAAEDTRRARQLLDLHGVALAGRPLLPYHDHNGAAQRPGLLKRLSAGEAVALVSDAGTPLVADPGWRLAREAVEAGAPVTAVPGASAALVALSLSGLPSDRFMFAGFPPPKDGERRRWLGELAAVPATLVVFESPRRVGATLEAMRAVLGDRPAALCRELTKRFEEVMRGTLEELARAVDARPPLKGEVVLVIGAPVAREADDATIDAALQRAMADSSVRDAARAVADAYGVPRKKVYQRALTLGQRDAENAGED